MAPLNLGVVSASVAYVDDLFFAHLQNSGVPEGVTTEVEEEIGRQLNAFRKDLGKLKPYPKADERTDGQR